MESNTNILVVGWAFCSICYSYLFCKFVSKPTVKADGAEKEEVYEDGL
jgi:hypothetical protein